MSRQEQLFQLWLDNQLNEQQQAEFEQLIANSPELQNRLNTAKLIEQQVYCHEQAPAPNWDPNSIFSHDKTPWWQWSGLPLASLCCSLFAVMLVVFNVEFSMQQEGFMVRFGQSQQRMQHEALTTKQLQQQVDQRLQLFAAEQALTLASLKNDLKDSQQTNNLELVTYLLASTRKERQEDISNFIQYVNEQRQDDAIDQKIHFQKLQLQLDTQSLNNSFTPISSSNK